MESARDTLSESTLPNTLPKESVRENESTNWRALVLIIKSLEVNVSVKTFIAVRTIKSAAVKDSDKTLPGILMRVATMLTVSL
jgi:hypothetical protein